ncbi:hypothetical protein [Amycolatopsis sp. NPDC054798]
MTLQSTIDCSDPQKMVAFWAATFRWTSAQSEVKAEAERLVEAGATVLRIDDEPDMGH